MLRTVAPRQMPALCAAYHGVISPAAGGPGASPSRTPRRYLHERIRRPPAPISNLRKLIRKSPSTNFPPELISLIDAAAIKESQSILSVSDEMYNDVTREMTSFMLKCTNSTDDALGGADQMRGEEVYNPGLLDTYDALVWGYNSPFLWRITLEDVQSLYKSNISKHHCDIGVGTGLLLSKDVSKVCEAIALIDLNNNSLDSCTKRIQSTYSKDGERVSHNISLPDITKLVADVTVPPEEASSLTPFRGKYESVGANFLLHCIHGPSLLEKEAVFRNCASLLDPKTGVFFGSTILGQEMLHDKLNAGENAMHVLNNFNESGVFGNLGDSMEDLDFVLRGVFNDVNVWRVGYCGLWEARNPK